MMYSHTANKQQGMALTVSLIMLVLLTILAISSMKTTILDEKMAGNYKDANTAFQAAEAAIVEAERYLATTESLPAFNGSVAGLHTASSNTESQWNTIDWDSTSGAKYITYNGTLEGVSESLKPKYIIEKMHRVLIPGKSLESGTKSIQYYRISTRATGNTDSARTFTQVVYRP